LNGPGPGEEQGQEKKQAKNPSVVPGLKSVSSDFKRGSCQIHGDHYPFYSYRKDGPMNKAKTDLNLSCRLVAQGGEKVPGVKSLPVRREKRGTEERGI
jgi:hypothetical protein